MQEAIYVDQEIEIDKLTIDPGYQRALGKSQVNKFVANFDPLALMVIAVSERADESLVVIDGQTRVAACLEAGADKISARIFMGLERAREADLFLKLNDRRFVTALDKWAARHIVGQEQCLIITDVLKTHGLRVPKSPNTGQRSILCVAALDDVYEQSGAIGLGQMIEVLKRSWPDLPDKSKSAPVIRGIALFNQIYHPVDTDELVKRLAGVSFLETYQRAITLHRDYRGNLALFFALSMLYRYNEGRKSKRLSNKLSNLTI